MYHTQPVSDIRNMTYIPDYLPNAPAESSRIRVIAEKQLKVITSVGSLSSQKSQFLASMRDMTNEIIGIQPKQRERESPPSKASTPRNDRSQSPVKPVASAALRHPSGESLLKMRQMRLQLLEETSGPCSQFPQRGEESRRLNSKEIHSRRQGEQFQGDTSHDMDTESEDDSIYKTHPPRMSSRRPSGKEPTPGAVAATHASYRESHTDEYPPVMQQDSRHCEDRQQQRLSPHHPPSCPPSRSDQRPNSPPQTQMTDRRLVQEPLDVRSVHWQGSRRPPVERTGETEGRQASHASRQPVRHASNQQVSHAPRQSSRYSVSQPSSRQHHLPPRLREPPVSKMAPLHQVLRDDEDESSIGSSVVHCAVDDYGDDGGNEYEGSASNSATVEDEDEVSQTESEDTCIGQHSLDMPYFIKEGVQHDTRAARGAAAAAAPATSSKVGVTKTARIIVVDDDCGSGCGVSYRDDETAVGAVSGGRGSGKATACATPPAAPAVYCVEVPGPSGQPKQQLRDPPITTTLQRVLDAASTSGAAVAGGGPSPATSFSGVEVEQERRSYENVSEVSPPSTPPLSPTLGDGVVATVKQTTGLSLTDSTEHATVAIGPSRPSWGASQRPDEEQTANYDAARSRGRTGSSPDETQRGERWLRPYVYGHPQRHHEAPPPTPLSGRAATDAKPPQPAEDTIAFTHSRRQQESPSTMEQMGQQLLGQGHGYVQPRGRRGRDSIDGGGATLDLSGLTFQNIRDLTSS